MADLRFVLNRMLLFAVVALTSTGNSSAQITRGCGKFCPDDPIAQLPKPLPVGKLSKFELDAAYDEIIHVFTKTGRRIEDGSALHAQNINTIDEVPDSDWYTNRPAMSLEQLRQGPAQGHAPVLAQPLTILSAKSEGATPGFVIQDAKKQRFVLKLDAPGHAWLETGADVAGSRIFYALGYNVPENYPAAFHPEQLVITPKSTFTDELGYKRPLTHGKLDEILKQAARLPDGRYSAMASYFISGKLIGPWLYYGTRSDDPNDIYPHQNLRESRGLRIFAAWVNHADATSLNTLNAVQDLDGVPRVRHFLIDFGSIMGSAATGPRYPFLGYTEEINFSDMAVQIATLGTAVPAWQRARYPNLSEVGNFESAKFDPITWVPSYRNPAFDLCQPEDAFWAIRKMMAISPEGVRAMVEAGGYQSPASVDWITQTLLERRKKIVESYAAREIFLDHFRIEGGQLRFDDLALQYLERPAAPATVRWYLLENKTGNRREIPEGHDFSLPQVAHTLNAETLLEADLSAPDINRLTRITIAHRQNEFHIVGVERLSLNSSRAS